MTAADVHGCASADGAADAGVLNLPGVAPAAVPDPNTIDLDTSETQR